MSKHVSIKVSDEYNFFEVSEEVYIYIRQLEHYIRYPDKSDLLELYPLRFFISNN